MSNRNTYYSPQEERLNIWTHGIGFLLSILATILLTIKGANSNVPFGLGSFLTFGLSLCILYLASTLYHATQEQSKRLKLKVFDHAAIFVLIAGTYTPFTLVSLREGSGILLFWIVWGIALTGVILKVFFTGRFNILSTIMYVGMGWLIVFASKQMMENVPEAGLWWLASGGIAYTIGAVFYSIEKLPFNHAIFHVFVLAGSFCHFMSIYYYVI